jgi:CheY-like chemotaxis protein
MRILIVDDEDEALRAMSNFLAGTDGEIVLVSDSVEAARNITTEHFDVMFIDYVMPPPNGMELMSLARKSPMNHETPIVLVTGYDDFETRGKGAEAGATYFLAKPFTPEKIQSMLRAAATHCGSLKAAGTCSARDAAGL